MKTYYIKRISACLIISLVCLTVSSCKKDFLERAPSDLIDEEKVFSNIDNAEAFLNNAYREAPQLVYRNGPALGSFFNLGSGTDEGANMWGHAKTSMDFNSGNWNAVSYPLDWAWFAYYSSIRRINIFIANYNRIPEEVGGQQTSSRKKRMLGEAYGLRAYYYFLLYTMWGEVPLVKTALLPGGDEDVKLPRSPVTEVVQFIAEDLQTAIANLPAKHIDSQAGRFSAMAAKALLSRLYLYYASPLSNPQNELQRWQDAARYAQEAIDFAQQNGYALSLSNAGRKAYERIFLEINNPEVLWSVLSPYEGDGGYWDYWGGSIGQNGWYGEGPIQEMVDSYEMTNGEIPVLGYNANNTQIINPAAGYDAANPYANRDPRFYQTILYHGATWKGRAVNVAPGGGDFSTDKPRVNYFWRKYMLEDRNLFTNTGNITRKFVVFRLAEMYLNLAEARNEMQGSPDAEVYSAVNTVRDRVDMPGLPNGLSQVLMREKIRHERKIELAMENHRFWDVRRWKIAEETDNKPVHKVNISISGTFSYPVWTNRVFDRNRHYLFPIPQAEIDKNRQILTQNPGW